MAHTLAPAARVLTAAATGLVLGALPLGAAADFQLNGSIIADKQSGTGSLRMNFACAGTPACNGSYGLLEKDSGCSNSITLAGRFQMTGLDLAKPGIMAGNITLFGVESHSNVNADGTCTYVTTGGDMTLPYTASWNGSAATLAVTAIDDKGQPHQLPGTFTASQPDAAPVFPATITTAITSTTASASGTIHPRAQDVGKRVSVYVFVHAPATLVRHAAARRETTPRVPAVADDDGAVVCVLAQVGPDGHLVAASASTMQAYFTGVLGSQGQAVNMLNSVATANVAGSAVYVGYGTSASDMLANGIYQGAATVPGPVQCATNLASAPAPKSAGALSGLWWNASESGWGIDFTQRGANLFAAWYTYDGTGNPKWYVAPNCAFANPDATSGSCSSPLYEVNGPAFFGAPFNPNLVHATQDGTLQLAFQDTNAASMTYTLPGFTRTVPIVRQVFPVAQTDPPAIDYTDLWWNASESGWGIAITQQYGNMFLAWYVYDATGRPIWYVAPACTVTGSACSGTLYRTTGPAFGPPLDPAKVQATEAGSAIVSFVDANNAVLSYVVDGVNATKVITRQLF